MRAGNSGDDRTRVKLRSVICTCPTGPDTTRKLFGEDALKYGDRAPPQYQIKRGVVINWDMTRCAFEYSYVLLEREKLKDLRLKWRSQKISRRFDDNGICWGFEWYIAGGPGAAGPQHEGLFTWGCEGRSPHIFSLTSSWKWRPICVNVISDELIFKPIRWSS